MQNGASVGNRLASEIVERIDKLIFEAEAQSQPLEIDPHRGQLFELFVTADAAGYTQDGADPNLSAEGLCRLLAKRWGLADAARASFDAQRKLPGEHVARMRLLWSVMRMWMEWSYAWERWPEFHAGAEGG